MTSIYGSGYIADMATPADTEGCAACVTCGQPWPAAPADMVMVPREPTPEMIIEGSCAVKPGGFIEDIYAAMIAAAPAPAVPATFVVPGFAQWRDGSAAPVVPLTDERAAFEAWIRKDSGDLTTFGQGANMHYRNSAVNNAWTGWHARAVLSAAPVVREPQDERDARIEALQTECDASNMEVIELTAEVAALRAEVANLTKIIDEAWGEA